VKTCPVCRASYPGKPPRCPLDGATLEDSGPDLLGGRVVAGRYRLVERVGVGTTAEVYRTHDLRSGAVVAARVPVQHGHEASRVRIHDQVKAFRMAAPHEALVPVLDLLDRAVAGRVVAITEYVSAPPLPHLLAAGPLALPVALEAGARLAALLEHLHTRDVLARDLRASAVFVAATPGSVGVKLSIDALAPGPVCPPETHAVGDGRAHRPHTPPRPTSRRSVMRGEPVSHRGERHLRARGALLFEIPHGPARVSGRRRGEIVRAAPGGARAGAARRSTCRGRRARSRPCSRGCSRSARSFAPARPTCGASWSPSAGPSDALRQPTRSPASKVVYDVAHARLPRCPPVRRRPLGHPRDQRPRARAPRPGRRRHLLRRGEPDFDTPENIRAAGVRRHRRGQDPLHPVSGIADLRAPIAEHLRRRLAARPRRPRTWSSRSAPRGRCSTSRSRSSSRATRW
jgi:hypothetical protein